MTAQKGRDLLLKIGDDEGNFTTIAGLRSRQFSLNAESVDITDSESAGQWRELLSGAGIRRAGLSGSGIFKDKDSDEKLRSAFFAGSVDPWQIIIPDFGTLTGLFQITALEYGAQHNGEVTFEMALESGGEISFEVIA